MKKRQVRNRAGHYTDITIAIIKLALLYQYGHTSKINEVLQKQ